MTKGGNMNNNIVVSMYEGMGRGLTNLTTLAKGQFVMQCELLVLSYEDTEVVNQTELKHYTFKYNKMQDCLVLGLGEIFNHSDTANVRYELQDLTQDGVTRKVMVFYALEDIAPGNQLFIDYTADTKVNVNEYINSKSMVGV